jgi:hypothetical protein
MKSILKLYVNNQEVAAYPIQANFGSPLGKRIIKNFVKRNYKLIDGNPFEVYAYVRSKARPDLVSDNPYKGFGVKVYVPESFQWLNT